MVQRGLRFVLLTLAVPAWLAAGACEKVPLLAPTDSTITLYAANTVLPVNGATEITATVIESGGTPVQNGTLVSFTTTLGTIEPRDVRTSGGRATAVLNAGSRSGTASVVATSGGALATAVEIKIGAAAAGRIVLSATPSVLPSSGGTARLVAAVVDSNGNALPGVPVNFSTTSGTLSSSNVTSDANGEALTALTTDRPATVTVSGGGASALTATLTINLNVLPTVTVTMTTATPQAGLATSFTVAVSAGSNSSGIRAVDLSFGDGQSVSLGAITGSTTVSHIYASPGVFSVAATVTDTSGERVTVSTVVSVAAISHPTVGITTSSSNPTAGTNVIFTVTVTASAETAAVQNVSVDFGDGDSVDLGAVSGSTTAAHVYGSAGAYTVTATVLDAAGTSTSASLVVVVADRPPLSVTVTASPSTPTTQSVVTISASVTSGSSTSLNISRYEWDFGDGNQAVTTGNQTTHVYGTTGHMVIRVTVVATDGTTGYAQTEILVGP